MARPAQNIASLADPPPGIAAASALASPTRRRIADVLAEHPDGLGVADLADAVGLHANAVRPHLQRLADVGMIAVVRETPSGRGRPRLRYQLVDMHAPRIAAHQELVRLLVAYLAHTGASVEDVERFGRDQGAHFAEPGGAAAIVESFARLGFAPRQTGTAAGSARGRLEVRLDNCPFRDAVIAPGGELVCTLHRGLAEGIARRAAPAGGRVTAFEPVDAVRAGCRIVFDGLDEGSGDGG